MMSHSSGFAPSVSDQAREVVWRIFGNGESPLTGRSSYELIRPIVESFVPVVNQREVTREIQGWFESHGSRHWLRSEMEGPVATVIVKELKTVDWSETAVWAIGSIDANLAASLMHADWPPSAIDGFVHATLETLKTACNRNRVLDASSILGSVRDVARVEIPKDAFSLEVKVETFQQLLVQDLRLVFGLHAVVGNLIDLSMTLRPDQFNHLVESIAHPVVQARAAFCAIRDARHSNHRATLDWIRADSCPAQIAIAIVLSLETVNCLDHDIRWDRDIRPFTGHNDVTHQWSTELRPSCDDLDKAAANLLTGLVDSLLRLNPQGCVRWVGELLGMAPSCLDSQGNGKPARVQQLETACIEVLVRLARQSWSRDLTESLIRGLRTAPQETWTRHLGAFAWKLRGSAPKHAVQIAQVTLCCHETHIVEVLTNNIPMLDENDWERRERNVSLGACLAVVERTRDLQEWVVDRCRQLPLSAWDADLEGLRTFNTAEKVARHRFLVAFHAISPLGELGRRIDPAVVLSLTEKFFDHCHYAQPYVSKHPASSNEAEHVARYAVAYGGARTQWLLDLVRHPAVGARILWAIVSQGGLSIERVEDGGAGPHLDEMFVTELASIASGRFEEGRRCDLETLIYWGHLWLSLGKTEEAEQAALALLAFPKKLRTRARTILILKLLALVAGKGGLELPLRDRLQAMYRELWSVFTPLEERPDREQIDTLLKGLPHGLLSMWNT